MHSLTKFLSKLISEFVQEVDQDAEKLRTYSENPDLLIEAFKRLCEHKMR